MNYKKWDKQRLNTLKSFVKKSAAITLEVNLVSVGRYNKLMDEKVRRNRELGSWKNKMALQ